MNDDVFGTVYEINEVVVNDVLLSIEPSRNGVYTPIVTIWFRAKFNALKHHKKKYFEMYTLNDDGLSAVHEMYILNDGQFEVVCEINVHIVDDINFF